MTQEQIAQKISESENNIRMKFLVEIDKSELYIKVQEDERVTDELFTFGTSKEVAKMIDEKPTEYVKTGVIS